MSQDRYRLDHQLHADDSEHYIDDAREQPCHSILAFVQQEYQPFALVFNYVCQADVCVKDHAPASKTGQLLVLVWQRIDDATLDASSLLW